MDCFENFCKFFKSNQDDYDQLMQEKDHIKQVYDMHFSSKEFMVMFYINALINDKIPIHQIIKRIPREYVPLLQKTIKSRFKPKRILVEWSKMKLAFDDIEQYNKNKVQDYAYYRTIYPQRKIKISAE